MSCGAAEWGKRCLRRGKARGKDERRCDPRERVRSSGVDPHRRRSGCRPVLWLAARLSRRRSCGRRVPARHASMMGRSQNFLAGFRETPEFMSFWPFIPRPPSATGGGSLTSTKLCRKGTCAGGHRIGAGAPRTHCRNADRRRAGKASIPDLHFVFVVRQVEQQALGNVRPSQPEQRTQLFATRKRNGECGGIASCASYPSPCQA